MEVFGSGVLFGVRTDTTPNTPINFGIVQEVSLDISFDLKALYGQYQWPIAMGRGKGKLTGKAKMARVSGIAMSSLFFGLPLVSGELLTAFGEAHSIPGSTPFVVDASNSSTFVDDYGVVYAATGLPLVKVSALGSQTGQYVESGSGIYNFSGGDGSDGVLLNYTYQSSLGTTQELAITNQLMGTTPTFQAQLYNTFQGVPFNVKLLSCVSSKLGLATKLDDFMVPELDFEVQANAAGIVGYLSFGEVS